MKEQNDKIRRSGDFGPHSKNPLMVTPGVLDLGEEMLTYIYQACMTFPESDFEDSPDHDFGEIDAGGTRVWFKIDRHETEADRRIVTFLLPSEY